MTGQPGRDPIANVDGERSLPVRLAALEGRQVSMALDDGSRIDDCQLVSAGRHGVNTLWLFSNGADRFVPLQRVVEIWEAPSAATFCPTWSPS